MVPGPDVPDGKPRFSLRRFVLRRLRFLAVALPLACAVLLAPHDGWLLELLRHFRLWNAAIALSTGVLLLLFRDWKFAGIALLAGIWQGWPAAEYRWSPPVKGMAAEPGQSFTLLTCNLLYECREPERMVTSLREANADVVLFLEFTPEWGRRLSADLWRNYPHRLEEPATDAFGICLASRLPLENAKVMQVAGRFPAVRAEVVVAGRRITLLGVHPPPPVRMEMYEDWRASFEEWPALLGADGRRLLAGDLNCTPFARTFTAFCQRTGLRDSGRGFGLPNTWHVSGAWLGLPIDHVLVSDGLVVTERTVGPPAGSDHRWVLVRLAPVQ